MEKSTKNISRGQTARGVHRSVVEFLRECGKAKVGAAILDIPCGHGTLIATLREFFPGAFVKGADLKVPEQLSGDDFMAVDANRPFQVFDGKKFDVVLSISGVMEFDNTLQFFENCRAHLKDDGLFLVSNDNVISIRDRLSYLWLGKVRQYNMFAASGQATWKVISIYNMVRILLDAGFTVKEIRYVSMRPKDYMMLPLALLIYPVQFLYMLFSKHSMPMKMRLAMYPFSALLYRHYMLVCEKANPVKPPVAMTE